MSVERGLRMVGGFFVFVSAVLGAHHSPYWLIFTGFVGLNLFQSAFSNWCPMIWFLQRIGLRRADPSIKSPAAAASRS